MIYVLISASPGHLCQRVLMSSKKRNSSYVQEVDFTFGTTKRGKRRLQSVLVPSQGHKTPQTPAHIRKSQMLSSLRMPSSQAPLPAPDFGTPGTFPSIQVPMPKVLRKSGLVSLGFNLTPWSTLIFCSLRIRCYVTGWTSERNTCKSFCG